MNDDEKVLSAPEWEALLYGVADPELRRMLVKLAIRHSHLRAVIPDVCPLCAREPGPT